MHKFNQYLIVKETALSPEARILLLYLIENKITFLSPKSLAIELGFSRNGLMNALEELLSMSIVLENQYEGGLGRGFRVLPTADWRVTA